VGAAASLAGGARAAYALGSAAGGGSAASGLRGVARAARGGAAHGPAAGGGTSGRRAAAEQAISALRERYAAGEQTPWPAPGGEPTFGMGGEATVRPSAAAKEPIPAWAERLQRNSVVRSGERAVKEGEGGGAGMRPTLG